MTGRVWRFGDDIDTDVLAPGLYMKGPLDVMATHCLESVDPHFAANVRPGDLLVAGRNFGIGSSREQAAQVLKTLGIQAVIAESFGGIFYRNAINFGLPALVCEDVSALHAGAIVTVDPKAGLIVNVNRGETVACRPLPGHLLDIIEAGGLVPWLETRTRGSVSA